MHQVTADTLIAAWNSIDGFVACRVFHSARRKQLAARNREPFFRENWRQALEVAREKRFCFGENDRGWHATLDWFLRPATVPRLIEDPRYMGGDPPKKTITEARRIQNAKEWEARRKEYAKADTSNAIALLQQARAEGRA